MQYIKSCITFRATNTISEWALEITFASVLWPGGSDGLTGHDEAVTSVLPDHGAGCLSHQLDTTLH